MHIFSLGIDDKMNSKSCSSSVDLTKLEFPSAASSSAFDTWIKGPQYSLTYGDKSTILSPTGWLSDSVITAAQSLMQQDFPHISGVDLGS